MEGEANDEDLSPTYFEEGEEPKVEKAELDALERVVGDATAEAMSLTLALLKHITNGFSDETEIGRGGFSIVHLGTLPNGSRIAVKRITSKFLYMDERVFLDEVDITMKAAHKYTVRLIGHCYDTQMVPVQQERKTIFAEAREMLICTEYVPNGTLDQYITDPESPPHCMAPAMRRRSPFSMKQVVSGCLEKRVAPRRQPSWRELNMSISGPFCYLGGELCVFVLKTHQYFTASERWLFSNQESWDIDFIR